ncbi:hypothetical protein PanWU01x14_101390, partial [Parasponia andersonii]
ARTRREKERGAPEFSSSGCYFGSLAPPFCMTPFRFSTDWVPYS